MGSHRHGHRACSITNTGVKDWHQRRIATILLELGLGLGLDLLGLLAVAIVTFVGKRLV